MDSTDKAALKTKRLKYSKKIKKISLLTVTLQFFKIYVVQVWDTLYNKIITPVNIIRKKWWLTKRKHTVVMSCFRKKKILFLSIFILLSTIVMLVSSVISSGSRTKLFP